jgi:hypothetical protein
MVYIGQTGHSIENRVKEHHWHFCLYHPEKSAVAEHSINLDDCMRLHDSSVLAKNPLMDRNIRKAIEIELHSNSMNRENDLSLRKLHKPLIYTLKEKKSVFSKDKAHTYA